MRVNFNDLNKRQVEELAKFCLDISKLTLGTFVFGIFTNPIGLIQLPAMLGGLILFIFFFTMGIDLLKQIT